MSYLINRKKVRQMALDLAAENLNQGYAEVSQSFLDHVESEARAIVRRTAWENPTVGKKLVYSRFFDTEETQDEEAILRRLHLAENRENHESECALDHRRALARLLFHRIPLEKGQIVKVPVPLYEEAEIRSAEVIGPATTWPFLTSPIESDFPGFPSELKAGLGESRYQEKFLLITVRFFTGGISERATGEKFEIPWRMTTPVP